MKEQESENYVEKNYSRTVRYPEKKAEFEKGKCFEEGILKIFSGENFQRKIHYVVK